MKGKFVSVEGCEGAGKSTQVRLLCEYLTEHNVDYFFTREPGGTEIGEQIRGVILNKDNKEMSPECEALLYSASRVQLLREKILPELKNGKLVILDRYYDSSFAYQAYARGLGEDFVAKINEFALTCGVPDLTLFLDINPEDAFNRKGGVDKNDRMELSGLEFHKKVYNGYKLMQRKHPERIISVNCFGSKFDTHKNIIALLKEKGIINV